MHGGRRDRLALVYHYSGTQVFKNLNEDKQAYAEFGKQTRIPKLKLEPGEQLALDYIKDRLPGNCIFSLPSALAMQPIGEALLDPVPPPLGVIISDALETQKAVLAEGTEVWNAA